MIVQFKGRCENGNPSRRPFVVRFVVMSLSKYLAAAWCAALLFVFCSATSAQMRVPQLETEWTALDTRLLNLYRDKQYNSILEAEVSLGSVLLHPNMRRYLPTMCIALAFDKTNQPAPSLPYFEKALPLSFKADTLHSYVENIVALKASERGLRFLDTLRVPDAARRQVIAEEKLYLRFFQAIEDGDRRYVSGDAKGALEAYTLAQKHLDAKAPDAMAQKIFIEASRRSWDEYTYLHLYDTPGGQKRRDMEVRSFLKPKLLLSRALLVGGLPQTLDAVTFRMAAVVIRNVDVSFAERERRVRQTSRLDDNEVALHKDSWRFAMDAVQLFANGKLRVTTDWIELPDVTVKGLRYLRARGMDAAGIGAVRDLDPTQLEPPQDDLFAELTQKYDGVVFVWDRGQAGQTYSGRPMELPFHDRRLPVRAIIRTMAPQSHVNLHEFLHNLERVMPGLTV
ncbi:MAG: hypothetical protein JWN98_2163, partial [Abditibacteriota bacterium]|nr:hypothetical protein [Abditibacteriota bacterium]